MGPFLWCFDGTFPKNLDGKPGTNLAGFKGKVILLWPYQFKGKPDATGKSAGAKIGQMYGKVFKTKAVDSYSMTDATVAETIVTCFK